MNNREVSVMKLVNVTNSHSKLVLEQLENTDAYLVKEIGRASCRERV